jgi:hypothetical protein
MDDERKKQLDAVVQGVWKVMENFGTQAEEFVPADEAAEDRRALARRIGRLYLAFARVLIDRLGEEEATNAILEAIRDYSYNCAETRKKGLVDLPKRGIHEKNVYEESAQGKSLRSYGCGIAQEFRLQGEEKLGALYCYIDPCSFMFTMPNIKLYHKKMEPLGDDCCEFDIAVASDEEMADVTQPGRDYRHVDPIIQERTKGSLRNK